MKKKKNRYTMRRILLLCAICWALCLNAQHAKLLTTTVDRKADLAWSTQKMQKAIHTDAKLKLLTAEKYQTMTGFGAAVTGSAAYCLMAMAPEDRTAFLKQTFSPTEGFGCSFIRVAIGCSDFSLSDYTCCDKPGIENFALTDEETKYVIPIIREILAINPDLKILASPWTCPLWMKDYSRYPIYKNRPFTAGQLKPECYADYALYFLKWIRAFEAAGVPIHAVTLQNEPLNDKNSASLVMLWEEQSAFIKVIGPLFEKEQVKTKIYVFDHNYNYDKMESQQGYPLHIYRDPEVAKYVAGAAYHDYGGHHDELLKIKAEAPDKELVFTESSIGIWNRGHDLGRNLMANMQTMGIAAVNNGCVGVIIWNLMLQTDFHNGKPDDKVGGVPNRDGGCQSCFGAVDLDISDLKTIYRNSHYYMICQLSAVVKPGAVRIGTSADVGMDNLFYSAYVNPDGSKAVVLLNKSKEEQALSVLADDSKKVLNLIVPAQGVVSALIQK